MSESITVDYNLTVNVEDATNDIMKLQRSFMQFAGQLQRITGQRTLGDALSVIRQGTVQFQQLRNLMSTFSSANLLTMGVTGGVGAAFQVGVVALSFGEILYDAVNKMPGDY